MARVSIDDGILTDVANAIREQYGEDERINPLDFAELISAIEGGGGESQFNITATTLATESQTLTFEHDLGRKPIFCAIIPTNASDIIGKLAYKFVGIMIGLTTIGFSGTGNAGQLRAVSSTASKLDISEETIIFTNENSTYKNAVGVEYSCIYW